MCGEFNKNSYIMMGSEEELVVVRGWTGNHVWVGRVHFHDPETGLPQSW